MERIDPDLVAGELETINQYLDFQRATVMMKASGLDGAGLSTRVPPSSLTLGGLLNHLALVEDSWFSHGFMGRDRQPEWAGVDWKADPDFEFRTAVDLAPDKVRRRYLDACDRSRVVVAESSGPDQLSAVPRRDGRYYTLRWMMMHMLEETARHAGHADFLREAVDGATGE